MSKYIVLIYCLLSIFPCLGKGIEIETLKCDLKENPSGIQQKPNFSWELSSSERNQSQSAYRLLLSDDLTMPENGQGSFWDSGKILSEQSVLVAYAGQQLSPGVKYFWKVKVWDKNGRESNWSETATFTTALFTPEDWSGAKWIGYEDQPDTSLYIPTVHPLSRLKSYPKHCPVVPLFRRNFQIGKEVESAQLFICGLGQYKASINGKQVGDDFISPGWTDYTKTCLYNTYDITNLLKKGPNAIGVLVGNGFFHVPAERYRKLLINYGFPKMIGKIAIQYKDGTSAEIITDDQWKTSASPITFSSVYGGEDYDARLEQDGWDKADFNSKAWKNAVLVESPQGTLKPETTYPVTVREKITPKAFTNLGKNRLLVDFGQNASGIIQVKVKGEKGQKIRIIPAELINPDKTVNQRATGSPCYFEYTLKGGEVETWQPQFSYYGFRYAQIEGAVRAGQQNGDNLPELKDVTFLHTFINSPETGGFSCSNKLFNQINHLIKYAIQSNLQSVITDCPHREKLGWLECSHLMTGAIHFNYDLYHLLRKQVDDMIDAQTPNGLVPDVAPEYAVFSAGFRDSPEWGSSSVIVPWYIYRWYGDASVMQKAWPMMERYAAYLKSKSNGNILSHGLGDWFDLGPRNPGEAQLTPKALTATAIYYYDVALMSKMAGIMGNTDLEKKYSQWASEIKTAFNAKFYNPQTHLYSTGSQTAMSMPLCLGLVDKEEEPDVIKKLTETIRKGGNALTAGDVGFHYVIEALTRTGQSQLIFEMNNRDDVPGYGYQLKKGATALTESWAALEIVSNNHLMLGHLMEWFYQGLGGIRQAENSLAYKDLVIHPAFAGDFTEVNNSFNTPYGKVISKWEKTGKVIHVRVTIPVNTTAMIFLPAGQSGKITEKGQPVKNNPAFETTEISGKLISIKTGSGNYDFEIPL